MRGVAEMPLHGDRHLVVEVGPFRLGVPADVVSEIFLRPRLHRLPTAPAILEGMLNRRGKLVPVVDLHRLLGLEPTPVCSYSVIVVLQMRGLTWAAGVDRALDVAAFPSGAKMPPPADSTFNDCVTAVVEDRLGSIHLLESERLMTRREELVLGDLARFAEARRGEWSW